MSAATWTDPETGLVHTVERHQWWDGMEERLCWATPCNMEAMHGFRPFSQNAVVTCLQCIANSMKGGDI